MKQIWKLGLTLLFFLAAAILPGGPNLMGASDKMIDVGMVNGMEVQLRYLGTKENPGEKAQFEKGKLLAYRITLRNRSNRSFPQIELQTSLHVQESTCDDLSWGSRLPGQSISPLYTTAVASGMSANFDHAYNIPASLCSLSGIIKIRIQYTQRGIIKADTLTCPMPFRIN